MEIQVLSREEEARYGYLAAVNSTTLSDGVTLDLGGGSMQLVQVAGRRARDARSWRLGAVITTERFLPDERVKRKQIKALKAHVREELAVAPWLDGAAREGRRLAGIGGTVRNLAAAAQLAAGLPSYGVQGFALTRDALDALIEELADLPASERGRVPGIKPERGDLILAGALVIQTVMEVGGFDALESSEAGLREGVFFEALLDDHDPPLFERRPPRRGDEPRRPVPRRLHALQARRAAGAGDLGRARRRRASTAAGRRSASCCGRRRCCTTSARPSTTTTTTSTRATSCSTPACRASRPREIALIGQMARYHRKGKPSLGEFEPLAHDGDEGMLARCSAVLRLAEQLERPRDQTVHGTEVAVHDGTVELRLRADEDVTVSRWAAARQAELFARAFGRELSVLE